MVKSTMTETVPSSDRGGTAAAMAQNEQTTEEPCTLEQQSPGRLDHPGAGNASQNSVGHRHGTGSLGQGVNGSFWSSFTSGSPGHHFDPV